MTKIIAGLFCTITGPGEERSPVLSLSSFFPPFLSLLSAIGEENCRG